MFLGQRQMKFGTASVPAIKYFEKVDIKGYENIIDTFVIALVDKIGTKEYKHIGNETQEEKKFRSCFEQTITFLRSINALKPAKEMKELKLWKDTINLEPFYEGVAAQLKTMLIGHHYPSMAKAISEGRVYIHWGLTQISEAVVYLMEYLKKEDLLNPVDAVLKEKAVKKWIEDYAKWYADNKEDIKRKNKIAEENWKKDVKHTEELVRKLEARR